MKKDPVVPALPETMYRYVWQSSRRHQLALVALTATVFPLTMVPLELQRRIVDQAIGSREVELLFSLCAAYLGVLLAQGGLKFGLGVYRGMVSERAVRSLRQRVVTHAGGAKGTAVSMLVAEVEPVGGFVGESVAFPLLQAGILMSVLGYMLWLEPWIALAGFALCLPQLAFVPPLQAAINRRAKRRIELLRALGEQLAGKGGADAEASRRRIGEIYRLRVQVFLLKFSIKFLNNFLHHLGPLATFALGGWLVIQGRAELGTIVAFVSGFERIADPWRELISFYRQASDARVKYRLIADAA